ncbi:MAG: ArsA family ATPase [Actinomycetota bacterium]
MSMEAGVPIDTSVGSIDALLSEHHVIVCTGAGGVGKTTTSAALALRAAEMGRRTIVLTIDPAKRLAQSMGLSELGGEPRLVPPSLHARGKTKGELWAMMLDMKSTFDQMVADMTTPERAEKIFANPFYHHISSTLAGTQEYMAMEKLWELHEEGRWELIIIDTPPTRSALDFLEAPRRLTDFLEGRFLKLMMLPYMKAGKTGLRMINFGTRIALRAVTRITGSELFADVADFFQQFEGMYETFKARSKRVRELMAARRTAFVIVTSPTEASLNEARYFAERLTNEEIPLGGLIVNRAHAVPPVAGLEDPGVIAARVGDGLLADALRTYAAWRAVSVREERLLEGTLGAVRGTPVWRVPDLADDVCDMRSLREVGELLAAGAL